MFVPIPIPIPWIGEGVMRWLGNHHPPNMVYQYPTDTIQISSDFIPIPIPILDTLFRPILIPIPIFGLSYRYKY